MIKTEDEIIVDLSTSCSKEVAVAKLLGWMKGPIFPKVVAVHESGISADLLPMLQSLEITLQETLSHMRAVASQELVAAAETDAAYEELKEKEEAVTNIDSLIHKAFMYMSDIDEELAKDEASAIVIDQHTSEQTGVTHITLKSVDQWAKHKYGISILDYQEQQLSSEGVQVQPATQSMEDILDPKGGLSKTVANNLFTSFAFLVEAFADTSQKYGKDSPNINAIAKRIEELAAEATNEGKLSGQSHEAIKKRINKAMEVKKSLFQKSKNN